MDTDKTFIMHPVVSLWYSQKIL